VQGQGLRGLEALSFFGAVIGSGCPGVGQHQGAQITTGAQALDDPELARFVALAEAAERYAAHDPLLQEYRTGRASDLQGNVIDIDRLPRCSDRELAQPACRLTPFAPDEPIRWVRGVELSTGEPIWVPAVMASYQLRQATAAEQFSYRLSTGYAVHSDPVEAMARGTFEVIERDAITLTWLQKLRLPLISPDVCSETLDRLREHAARHFMDAYIFDATTDLEVPTAYCLLVAEHDAVARQVVGAATARTMTQAAEKAIGEALAIRIHVLRSEDPPESYADFSSISHGARYMGAAERASAFDFLIEDAHARVGRQHQELPYSTADALRELVRRLSVADMQAIAVNRTTRELADAGLFAVCVIIPDLIPMTLRPLAQFRAHPRLYTAPAAMGYPVHPEEELNRWPQPFI
jgi:ribosomal protein S12 methylthiotransferase accessory factor